VRNVMGGGIMTSCVGSEMCNYGMIGLDKDMTSINE
jgi:hypothetical protein